MERIFRCEIPLGEWKADERTIGDLLLDRSRRFSSQTAILEKKSGEKAFCSYSWKNLFAEIEGVSLGLMRAGVEPGDRVAILSQNQKDMFVAVMAIYAIGAMNVPIFSGYFPEQVQYILSHSQAKFLIVADAGQLAKVGTNLPDLKTIFLMDRGEKEQRDARVQAFETLRQNSAEGKTFRARIAQTKPDDICAIMYTSGTTGRPKGVELTHRNFMSQQKAISLIWNISSKDRLLSYLPWHHCFGGIFEMFMAVYFGIPMAIDFSRGKDFSLLVENWREIKPTFYLSVPAVYQAIIREIEIHRDLERVFFHPDLRFVFTAAAPLSPDLYQAFISRGIPVHEGWGLTETSPDITLTRPNKKHRPGIVGEVIPGVEIKLTQENEILACGPNIMKGYYRDPEATQKVLQDGWLHTGDLGEISEEGLRIVGRADGVFKLINGEKVASAQMEGLLVAGSKFIDRAVVLGSGKEYVSALLFCQEKTLTHWAREKGISYQTFADLVSTPAVKDQLLEDVRRVNLETEIKYYRIRYFVLIANAPTLESGELTPTAKLCRQRVLENYQHLVQALYGVGRPEDRAQVVEV